MKHLVIILALILSSCGKVRHNFMIGKFTIENVFTTVKITKKHIVLHYKTERELVLPYEIKKGYIYIDGSTSVYYKAVETDRGFDWYEYSKHHAEKTKLSFIRI